MFLTGYFHDLLAGCIILAAADLLLDLGGLPPVFRRPAPCLGLVLACGLFWELVTPLYRAGSVSDPWDLAAYLAGGLCWLMVVRMAKGRP